KEKKRRKSAALQKKQSRPSGTSRDRITMLEIEQKFTCPEFTDIEERLSEWQAKNGKEQIEADHYFNAPDRDFARTDEAFRLRRIGSSNCLTYKGPKQAAAVKKRVELEVPI